MVSALQKTSEQKPEHVTWKCVAKTVAGLGSLQLPPAAHVAAAEPQAEASLSTLVASSGPGRPVTESPGHNLNTSHYFFKKCFG